MIGADVMILTLAALVVPAAVAFWLARRHGLGVLWATLIAGALLGIAGWIWTRAPALGDDAIDRSITIYFILLPGFVSLVLGAAAGALAGRDRDAD